jgi:hypothetical protein
LVFSKEWYDGKEERKKIEERDGIEEKRRMAERVKNP